MYTTFKEEEILGDYDEQDDGDYYIDFALILNNMYIEPETTILKREAIHTNSKEKFCMEQDSQFGK